MVRRSYQMMVLLAPLDSSVHRRRPRVDFRIFLDRKPQDDLSDYAKGEQQAAQNMSLFCCGGAGTTASCFLLSANGSLQTSTHPTSDEIAPRCSQRCAAFLRTQIRPSAMRPL